MVYDLDGSIRRRYQRWVEWKRGRKGSVFFFRFCSFSPRRKKEQERGGSKARKEKDKMMVENRTGRGTFWILATPILFARRSESSRGGGGANPERRVGLSRGGADEYFPFFWSKPAR